jgi:hypothetical protein
MSVCLPLVDMMSERDGCVCVCVCVCVFVVEEAF